jgi:hypothetical protein
MAANPNTEREFPAITHPKKRAYLHAFAETGNGVLAAKAAKVCRKTTYNWTQADKEFVAALADATEMAGDRLEAEAWRRAHDGLVRYKFLKNGKPILHPVTKQPYYELEYSDTLLIFLLKGIRPAKYRERQSVEHSGPDGGPIEVIDARDYITSKLTKFVDTKSRRAPEASG